MSMSKKTSSKKIVNLVGILLVVGFIILVACNMSHSKVFKLEKGEAEALGVVFPEEGSSYESYNSLFDKFMKDKEYEKAIIVAKKMIEVFDEGYYDLRSSYIELGRYKEAIEVSKKILKLGSSIDGRDVLAHIYLLDASGRQKEALKISKKYRKILEEDISKSETDELIKRAEQSVITGEKIFPESGTIK